MSPYGYFPGKKNTRQERRVLNKYSIVANIKTLSGVGACDHVTAHVGTEHFRHHHGSVSLLIVFQDGGYRTAYCQTGAVEGMDVFRFGFGIPAEPDVGPAGLEIFRIGAGRDFPVFVLFREPDFHIVAFGGREAQIPVHRQTTW